MTVHGAGLEQMRLDQKQVMSQGKRTIRAMTGRANGSGALPGAAHVPAQVCHLSARLETSAAVRL